MSDAIKPVCVISKSDECALMNNAFLVFNHMVEVSCKWDYTKSYHESVDMEGIKGYIYHWFPIFENINKCDKQTLVMAGQNIVHEFHDIPIKYLK